MFLHRQRRHQWVLGQAPRTVVRNGYQTEAPITSSGSELPFFRFFLSALSSLLGCVTCDLLKKYVVSLDCALGLLVRDGRVHLGLDAQALVAGPSEERLEGTKGRSQLPVT